MFLKYNVYNEIKISYNINGTHSGGIKVKFLVFSDSHNYTNGMDKAIETHKDITHIIHLGDMADDVFYLNSVYGKTHAIKSVCGNNDFLRNDSYFHIVQAEEHRIYITHGHREHVKMSLYELKSKAISSNCDICLFGHTHKQFYDFSDGLHILNPGSIGYFKEQYAVLDVTKNNVNVSLY